MFIVVGSHGQLGKEMAKFCEQQLTGIDSLSNTEYSSVNYLNTIYQMNTLSNECGIR